MLKFLIFGNVLENVDKKLLKRSFIIYKTLLTHLKDKVEGKKKDIRTLKKTFF